MIFANAVTTRTHPAETRKALMGPLVTNYLRFWVETMAVGLSRIANDGHKAPAT